MSLTVLESYCIFNKVLFILFFLLLLVFKPLGGFDEGCYSEADVNFQSQSRQCETDPQISRFTGYKDLMLLIVSNH